MQSVVKATLIIFGIMIALADSKADSIKIDDGQSSKSLIQCISPYVTHLTELTHGQSI